MKKSEFIESRRGGMRTEIGDFFVERDIEAAEAAGVVWDPEEEPLPEQLEVRYGRELWPVGVVTITMEARRRFLEEAANRYNLWEEIRKRAKLALDVLPVGEGRYHVSHILMGLMKER